MNRQHNGGPAFPNVPSDPGYTRWDTGMTLRDYFAGQVLCGMLADTNNYSTAKANAELAYVIADAMLAAREKGAQP